MDYEKMWNELKRYLTAQINVIDYRCQDCNSRKEKILRKIQFEYKKTLNKMNELEK